MISLGSSRWTSGNPEITLTFAYEKRRSGADMQYRAQITVSAVSGAHYFGYPIYMKLTIGGVLRETKTLKEASPNKWSNAITYTSSWYTVSNKTTGTVPVSFNVYSGLGSSRTGTYTYNMGVDPAASTISASGGTLGTALSLTVTRYNSSFTDTITYTCGKATGTVKSGSTATQVTWDTTNGNTLSLAAQNTSGISVSVTFTVKTYSGSTLVGTNTANVAMAIPANVKPSVALNISDDAGYFSTYGAYVQGHSRLKIIAKPTLAYMSPIKTYSIVADSYVYSTSTVVTRALIGKGTLTVSAQVMDSRNRSSDATIETISVLPYSKPVVNLTAYRCNSSGAEDPEGAYMKIEATGTISSLGGKNSATYKVVHSGSTIATGTGTTYTGIVECDVSHTHTIEVIIADDISSTTKVAAIPIAYTLIDYYHTGEGVSFGKVATRDGFDCDMPGIYFNENRLQEVGSPVDDGDAVPLGFLQDYVVEQGTKDIWTYRKWNSGRAECWGRREVDANINTAWGSTGFYYGTVGTVNFPFKFSEVPAVNVTVEYGSDNYSLFIASCGYSSMNYARPIMLCRNDARTVNCILIYHVFGTWK